jgi:hypothetical protein
MRDKRIERMLTSNFFGLDYRLVLPQLGSALASRKSRAKNEPAGASRLWAALDSSAPT